MKGKIALEEHYQSPDFNAAGSHDFTKGDYFENVKERLLNIDLRIQDMDKNGIETYIMSLTQPGIEGLTDAVAAEKMAVKMNDYCAANLIAKHPDRLRAFACVPLQNPKAAAKELERAVKQHGFVGALINGFSNIGNEETAQYLDEPQVEPFWQKVEELGVPVYLHPRIPLVTQRRIYQGYDGLLGSAWGFGVETSTHAVRLILSGLFDRHPNLQIILGHLGEALPFTLPRLEHRLRHQRAETQGSHKLPVTEYLRKNFYLTTSGTFRSQALLDTMLEVGSDRILFSVDSPYEDASELSPWFDAAPISDNDRVKIGRENSRKLFKL
ncbi:amidohydrolase family protein [Shimwellia blattae]|uniref:Putative amidohydrolase family protein n=1 Tax=Shimwellia blattae (strain ATCC 29907 / DSM 4481 / JCM 1650 / NBRC 105725 / CDC 9005-74) TaxID=630626 RepID=I2B4T2_SHIBC|nr:amidohydrolase family protein [Shimwellia blattae]AFJ45536.1 putative amidohydrolase family protein [Shimwellia blattae DSM 4481 = NBRC 105725]GAB81523.1 putative amidohydrolase [Shimwellia blattae DSM 4481 = NBRC 105725]VDY63020.1 Predicted metal-dependent hydrolase of the TIM-barrel fold [Shimwellia blattae]VEC20139.1 Predicted metal-dependent hydrolase of the TIM-barrel fold [Shimwellia blattae]